CKHPDNVPPQDRGGRALRFRGAKEQYRTLRPQKRRALERPPPMTAISAGAAKMMRTSTSALERLADNERWLSRAMLAPAILYIVLLVGFPFVLSIYYSLSSITVASRAMHWAVLENFQRVVESGTFWLALKNTVIITIVSQLVVIVLANILAMALIADFHGKWFVRLLILLPWVAPISLGSIGWLWIYDSIYSIINWTGQA